MDLHWEIDAEAVKNNELFPYNIFFNKKIIRMKDLIFHDEKNDDSRVEVCYDVIEGDELTNEEAELFGKLLSKILLEYSAEVMHKHEEMSGYS